MEKQRLIFHSEIGPSYRVTKVKREGKCTCQTTHAGNDIYLMMHGALHAHSSVDVAMKLGR